MRKSFILALAAVIMTTVCACGNSAEKSGTKENLDTTLCQFDNISKSYRMQYIEEEGDTFYIDNSVRFFWPKIINGKAATTLQNALRAELVDSAGITEVDQIIKCLLECNEPEGAAAATLKPVTEFEGEMPNISSANVNVQLKELGRRLLTYHIYYDEYGAGAAHGIYANRYVTYDLKNDKVVTLNDIVADTNALRSAILRSIKQEYQYDKDDLILPENGILPLPQNFYIDGMALHAVYQVYEIASYAQGMIDAPIYPYMINDKATGIYTPYGREIMGIDDSE